MTRIALLAALLALPPSTCVAQPQPSPVPPPIRLDLQPMPAPVPALKFHLLPELRDQNPGNAVQLYYRAFSPEWFGNLKTDSAQYTALLNISRKPLREITPAELKKLAEFPGKKMLEEVDRAARRPYADWELTQRLRVDGFTLLLPDIQSTRVFANLLRMRGKVELSQRQFDKAARTLQTGLAMGRHVASGPNLIMGLVGVADATIILEVLEDWISLPGSPNLYWALTDLPNPLIDLRNGFEGERLALDSYLPGYREMLADPTIPPPSAQQLQLNQQKIGDLYSLSGLANSESWKWQPALLALQVYSEAKRFLLEHGRTAEQVEAMPVLHALFLYETYTYDVAYDDLRKSVGLPYPEALEHARRAMDRYKASESIRRRDLAWGIVPTITSVFGAKVRTERKIAALRCIEAIRLHAATNGGKLPGKLSEITQVPVPFDPTTGKPFEYSLTGDKAKLIGLAPAGETPTTGNSIRYELTLRSSKGDK